MKRFPFQGRNAPSEGSIRVRDSRDNFNQPFTESRTPTSLNSSRMDNTSDLEEIVGEDARIRVVVRVRPTSNRQGQKPSKTILFPNGDQQIIIWDPVCLDTQPNMSLNSVDSCWSRKFCFDKCLWSNDINSKNYASQDTVFDQVGEPIVKWMLEGYNCCVLAYGQTGAGKSYTMMGEIGGDPSSFGLIPRICFALFEALEQNSHDGNSDEVLFSHMEIYNEIVKDLLADPRSNSNASLSGLRVREHPQHGIFVSNLTTVQVNSFEDVMSLIAVGDKNRTVAATNSNLQSSRSHAIVTLTLLQRTRQAMKDGLPTSTLKQKVSSRVHLVDLAGSERVTFSGAKGDRLKEANNINRSLSVLGDVIKSLGDLKGKRGHIPYRNSTLTMVLKDSLGGNSHVVMVSAVSPTSFDYEETMSTLKYSDRAKRVRIRVEANITSGIMASDASAVELVPILQAEVQKLRELLRQQQLERDQQGVTVFHGPQIQNQLNEAEKQRLIQMQERVSELERQLVEREKLIEHLKLTSIERGSPEPSLESHGEESLSSSIDYSVRRASMSEISPVFTELRRSLTSGLSGIEDFNRGQRSNLVPLKSNNDSYLSSYSNSSVASASVLAAATSHSSNGVVTNVAGNAANRAARRLVVLADDAVDASLPRMINLNQDPLFSECLVYYLVRPSNSIPNLTAGCDELNVDIFLTGPDIREKHCMFTFDGEDVYIHAMSDALVFINGDVINQNVRVSDSLSQSKNGRRLSNNDRIAIGRFHLFRFESSHSQFGHRRRFDSNESSSVPSWEFAQEELLIKNVSIMSLKGPVTDLSQVTGSPAKYDSSSIVSPLKSLKTGSNNSMSNALMNGGSTLNSSINGNNASGSNSNNNLSSNSNNTSNSNGGGSMNGLPTSKTLGRMMSSATTTGTNGVLASNSMNPASQRVLTRLDSDTFNQHGTNPLISSIDTSKQKIDRNDPSDMSDLYGLESRQRISLPPSRSKSNSNDFISTTSNLNSNNSNSKMVTNTNVHDVNGSYEYVEPSFRSISHGNRSISAGSASNSGSNSGKSNSILEYHDSSLHDGHQSIGSSSLFAPLRSKSPPMRTGEAERNDHVSRVDRSQSRGKKVSFSLDDDQFDDVINRLNDSRTGMNNNSSNHHHHQQQQQQQQPYTSIGTQGAQSIHNISISNSNASNNNASNTRLTFSHPRQVNRPPRDFKDSVDPEQFEREALALQKELSDMQLALQARMERYQVLTKNPSAI